MRLSLSKDWCMSRAREEDESEVGAGLLSVDPSFEHIPEAHGCNNEATSIAFGRFVQLVRREKGLTIEALASIADVDIEELVEIEEHANYRPEPRTVYQLANVFELPRANLLQVAGITAPRDPALCEEAVRFAARSESVEKLNSEERHALEAFVAVLSQTR